MHMHSMLNYSFRAKFQDPFYYVYKTLCFPIKYNCMIIAANILYYNHYQMILYILSVLRSLYEINTSHNNYYI